MRWLHGTNGISYGGDSDPEFQALLNQPALNGILVAEAHTVEVGVGNRLTVYTIPHVLATYPLEQPIRRLCSGTSAGKQCVVICFERGVGLHWFGDDQVLSIDRETIHPVACFTRDGRLVIIGDYSAQICDLDHEGVVAMYELAWLKPAPIAVIPAGSTGEFATFSNKGLVEIWNWK
jgi:hypothetical protein